MNGRQSWTPVGRRQRRSRRTRSGTGRDHYQLHVKSSSNKTAMATSRADLPSSITSPNRVNTIWLLPFYPSPRLDDGYDIAEYTGFIPSTARLEDVKLFIEERIAAVSASSLSW